MSNQSPDIRRVGIPTDIDAADAADFIQVVAARNAVYAEIAGNHDEDAPPAQLLAPFHENTHLALAVWAVRVDDTVIGRAFFECPLEPDSRSVFVETLIPRAYWGRGLGGAAHAIYVARARSLGRTVMQTWAEHPADGSVPQLTAPTGYGQVPADHTARFLQRRGYVLEQVERRSTLDLLATRAHVDALHSQFPCPDGYEVLSWQGATPHGFAPAFARLKERMSTDAPSAGLDIDAQSWDAERVAESDAIALAGARSRQTTVIRHVASGELVAFNELSIGADRTTATEQGDTLVASAHRGRKLGMVVKLEGLRRWRDFAPASPRVVTWNAEENRPMLDVNEAIGFIPAAYIGAWRLDLTTLA